MNLRDITLVLGVDAKHLNELRWAWPTWMRHKPELNDMPCVIFYDADEINQSDLRFIKGHPHVTFIAWTMPSARSQREKMLSGFVHVPARHVSTPWYLKIDTDVIATGPGEWIKAEWFAPNETGEKPVFIASPWGYTKPRYAINMLDDWADGIAGLAVRPRLDLNYSTAEDRVRHPRIISWMFFGRTDWTREMAALAAPDGRLPFPSQDTFLFYCAERLGKPYKRVQMSAHHWRHGKLREIRREVLSMGLKPARSSKARNDQGVVYYNRGTSCTVRLLVSLHSLRKHYTGRVAILSDGEESHAICLKIGGALDAEVIKWDPGISEGKNMHFLAKTRLHQGTPFDATIALDSDTLVTGPLQELFELLETEEFCVARFSNWWTNGRIMEARLRQWMPLFPQWVEQAVAFGPAINIGLIGFRRDASLFTEWHDTAARGREYFIPDEVSCQLLLPRHPHRILDGRWNRSCRHDDPALPETRVVHYHGKKHCLPDLPYHGEKWVLEYEQVVRQNVADIASWTPAGDRKLKRYLESVRSHGPGSLQLAANT